MLASSRPLPSWSAEQPQIEMPRRTQSPILHFLGGAGTVTGSRFLLDAQETRILVDCGLFQGLKDLRLRNWEPFPVDPASIDAVVLTHAHLDHAGNLPTLAKSGFGGRVFATRGTRELADVVLKDSARIQEIDAAYANRKGFSKHDPALPLYTQEDATRVLSQFETIDLRERVEIAAGIELRLHNAGHILGSAIAELIVDGEPPTRLVFSGDLGRPQHPLLLPPDPPPEADVIVIESTYGDRQHEDEPVVERFVRAIVETVGRGGVVVIPAFAVDRTEVVLRLLEQLVRAGRVPPAPIYVDSPMALAALEVYRRAIREGWEEIRPELRRQDQPLAPERIVEVRETADSRELCKMPGPAIIVSASGMVTGGRVLHHLAARLPDARNCVLLVGYQAAGTRGRHLLSGARMIKMLGQYVPVRARVTDLSAFSVHADRDELLAWAGRAPRKPLIGFVVHGEPEASASLRDALERDLDWTAVVPRHLERVRLR